MSDSYLESVQQNNNKTLTEVISIVKGRKAANLPMLNVQEELCEDYLQEWADLFGAENAK